MRITVHLDTFDYPDPSVYAILWLDTQARKWSREGHAVIDVPEWGVLTPHRPGTRVAGPHGGRTLCELEGLDLCDPDGPFEGESGRALWHCHGHPTPVIGKWHVQCVDPCASLAENGFFAGDEN
jgi:hypothetical protein